MFNDGTSSTQGKPKPKPSSPKCDTIPTKEPTVNDHEKTIPLSEPIAKATIKPKDKSIQNITSTRKTTKYKEGKIDPLKALSQGNK